MLTTALEVVGLVLIAVALGLTFGLGAFIGAAGVGFMVVGVALEGTERRSSSSSSDAAPPAAAREV